MFKRIFIEERVKDSPITKNITSKFKMITPEYIEKIEDIWGRVKKPYLQKRDNLNLFIGKKEGQLVKLAPDAYGKGKNKHYYFIHAYNCIYECAYCYLQGYFNTPDIVLFVNHEDILKEIEKIILENPDDDEIWFHAGEYSDSLALSHLTKELDLYFDFFKKHKKAKLELRTKSVNIKVLETLQPVDNIFVSFSLSPSEAAKEYDLKTPGTNLRLMAISKLYKLGYKIGIHFDPVIYKTTLIEDYTKLIKELSEFVPLSEISYLSVGVVRFTKEVYFETKKNYGDSNLLKGEFIKSFDGKVRYNRPMRMWVLKTLKNLIIEAGLPPDQVYLCMEEDDQSSPCTPPPELNK